MSYDLMGLFIFDWGLSMVEDHIASHPGASEGEGDLVESEKIAAVRAEIQRKMTEIKEEDN